MVRDVEVDDFERMISERWKIVNDVKTNTKFSELRQKSILFTIWTTNVNTYTNDKFEV